VEPSLTLTAVRPIGTVCEERLRLLASGAAFRIAQVLVRRQAEGVDRSRACKQRRAGRAVAGGAPQPSDGLAPQGGSQTIVVRDPYGLFVPAPTSTHVPHTAQRLAIRFRTADSPAGFGTAAALKSRVP
jgi:hypothetical protein